MPLRTPLALPLLALAILLTACGEDTPTSLPHAADGATLYVRATGMVQSEGITWLGWPNAVLDAVRVLEQVESASFNVPTETFTIRMRAGAESTPVVTAIEALGYGPELLDGPPDHTQRIARLDAPTSTAVREGLARARTRDVPLVVALGGPFCRLCRLFEETTLEDERVRTALEAVAFLQVDVELDPAAARDFDVHGVPDFWLLDGKGRVLARVNDYLDPDEFLSFLGLARD